MRNLRLLLHLFVLIATTVTAAPNQHYQVHRKEGTKSTVNDDSVFRRGYIGKSRRRRQDVETAGFPTPPKAAPTAASIPENNGAHKSGGDNYIVVMKSGQLATSGNTARDVAAAGSSADDLDMDGILDLMGLSSSHPDVKATYKSDGFRGFTASLQGHCLDLLNNRTDVAVVEKVQEVNMDALYERQGAPWGLQRISSQGTVSGDQNSLTFAYDFDDPTLGAGVDIYVIDTGINTQHIVFGGRASMLWSYFDSQTDDNGHGSHVSGTSAGTSFGVASGANLIGLKALDSTGTGTTDSVVQGILVAVDQHNSRKRQQNFRGSVINMSLSTGPSAALDAAVQQAVAAGVHIVTSAGNTAGDACASSPASNGGSRGSVLSIGSVGITGQISSFSNTGSCVDIYAPGEQVLSAWIGGSNVINFESGTSMASPHVAGLVATSMISQPSLANDPAGMKNFIYSLTLRNSVSGQALNGGQLLLANNGANGVSKRKRNVQRSVKSHLEVFSSWLRGRFVGTPDFQLLRGSRVLGV